MEELKMQKGPEIKGNLQMMSTFFDSQVVYFEIVLEVNSDAMLPHVYCKRVFSWRCCTWHSNNCKLDYNKPTRMLLHQPVKDKLLKSITIIKINVKSDTFFVLVGKEEFIFALKKLGITIVKTF
jgi:hypothetical protein